MSEAAKVSFLRRMGEDMRSARAYVGAHVRRRAVRRRIGGAEGELDAAHERIGAEAAERDLASDLPELGRVKEKRAAMELAQVSLREGETAEKFARDTLAAEVARHQGILSALGAERERLSAAAHSAGAEARRIEGRIAEMDREARRAQKAIDGAAGGKPAPEPVEVLREKLRRLAESRKTQEAELPAARRALADAEEARNAKEEALGRAKAACKEAQARCEGDVATAASRREAAAGALEAAREMAASAHRALGQAISDGGTAPGELEPGLRLAAGIAERLAHLRAENARLVQEAGTARGGALRFGAIVSGVLAGLVVVVLLVTRTGDRERPAAAEAASTPPGRASTLPVSPGTDGSTVPADIPPTLAAEILKLPALQAVYYDEEATIARFRPTGKLTRLDMTDRGDGKSIMHISADVERRSSPEQPLMMRRLALSVLVDGNGRLLSGTAVQMDSDDADEIERLMKGP